MHQQQLAESPLRVRPRRQTAIRIPFLFDPSQVRQLLALAGQLPDNNHGRQRGLIYPMIFALLYGLGLRVREAARLRIQDVDSNRCIITIRHTKFAKSRLVPFGRDSPQSFRITVGSESSCVGLRLSRIRFSRSAQTGLGQFIPERSAKPFISSGPGSTSLCQME